MESLSLVLEQALETYTENDITSLCLCLLELSGKTFRNGYKIITQHDTAFGIPDIIIRVLRNQENLLVIECKGGNGYGNKRFQDGREQISSYMRNLHFNYGLLAYPNRILFLTNETDPAIKTEWGTKNNDVDMNDMRDIIEIITEL